MVVYGHGGSIYSGPAMQRPMPTSDAGLTDGQTPGQARVRQSLAELGFATPHIKE